jgi:hypothetical protein
VLLLKENEHDESLVKCFGLENLNTLHESLLQKYVDKKYNNGDNNIQQHYVCITGKSMLNDTLVCTLQY